jgi:hypothetical protein
MCVVLPILGYGGSTSPPGQAGVQRRRHAEHETRSEHGRARGRQAEGSTQDRPDTQAREQGAIPRQTAQGVSSLQNQPCVPRQTRVHGTARQTGRLKEACQQARASKRETGARMRVQSGAGVAHAGACTARHGTARPDTVRQGHGTARHGGAGQTHQVRQPSRVMTPARRSPAGEGFGGYGLGFMVYGLWF